MWSKTRCHKLHAFGDHTQHTGIYSILASLYNLLRKDVEQDTLLQASMLLAIMPKTLVCLQHFCFFVQHTAQGCGARHVVTRIHAFGDHAQNTGIYSIFASLYNILRKDVEQDTLSQASMLWRPCPKHWYLPAATETYQTFNNYFVIFDSRSRLMRVLSAWPVLSALHEPKRTVFRTFHFSWQPKTP